MSATGTPFAPRYLLMAAAGIAVTAALWYVFASFRPPPGRTLTIASGSAGDAYREFAERYRQILAEEGVELRIRETAGSLENLSLLHNPNSGVDVAFVQGGSVTDQGVEDLVSLGVMFYEPMWFFCRCAQSDSPALDLTGKRASIGQGGSATRQASLQLLAMNGVDADSVQLLDYSPAESAEMLKQGELDVVVMVAAWDSPSVQDLLVAPGISLIDFRRADAYVALNRHLSKLTLPAGVADLAQNRPPADVTLVAPMASLVVREDLHSALQYLLVRAAQRTHGRAGVFHKSGEFPAATEVDLPISSEAQHLYAEGPSFLQRTLPFWMAEMVQRLLFIIVPLLGVVYPLWSLLPKLYRWQMQHRVYRLYGELKLLERSLYETGEGPEREQLLQRFDELERSATMLRLPDAYSAMGYALKMHIRTMRDALSESH